MTIQYNNFKLLIEQTSGRHCTVAAAKYCDFVVAAFTRVLQAQAIRTTYVTHNSFNKGEINSTLVSTELLAHALYGEPSLKAYMIDRRTTILGRPFDSQHDVEDDYLGDEDQLLLSEHPLRDEQMIDFVQDEPADDLAVD